MTINADTIEAVEDLARRVHDADNAKFYDPDHDPAVMIRTIRNDEAVQVVDLERHMPTPTRNRGTVTVHDPDDFAVYVNRLGDQHTTVWASEESATLTAVFNDHASPFEPGWRDHTAELRLQLDPDWTAWNKASGELMSQAAFAEFVEDQAHTVVSPDAATMLEIAQTFQATRNASFSQGTRLTSGDVQLAYHEETDAKAGKKGHLEIPSEFTIALAPFIGSARFELTARLRYRINGGTFGIGIKLHRPDLIDRDAFTEIRDKVAAELNDGVNVLLGHPPRLAS